MNLNKLIKNSKKDNSAFPNVKVSLLGDSATQLLAKTIIGYGYEIEYGVELFEADYDQIKLQILNPNSELYAQNSEFVIIAESSQKIKQDYYNESQDERINFAENKLKAVKEQVDLLGSLENLKAILYFNIQEEDDSVYGNYANKIESSFLYQIRKYNYLIMQFASSINLFHIVDYKLLHQRNGDKIAFSSQSYVNNSMVFNLEILPLIAKSCIDIIVSQLGVFKKCLIIDLDNTMWGGIIGDDGIDKIQIGSLGIGKAFTNFQKWIKELKNRGVILAICSKNFENIAKDVFINHPEMILRLEDISVFVANWDNKADNIKYIQSVLNIGFDSMVFLDDNPFEREIVKKNIPSLTVPELSEDPSEYVDYLKTLNLFETASYVKNDAKRTLQYQEESKRKKEEIKHSDQSSFLKSLNMEIKIDEFDSFNQPRIAQLIQRSNQFNLRTIRYTETELEGLSKSKNHICLALGLKDNFGEYGIISIVILEKKKDILFIDTWVMSCRVLKRGVEEFVFNYILKLANSIKGIKKIKGEYIPTKKNIFVKNLYQDLGFYEENDSWIFSNLSANNKECFIKEIN